MGKLFDLARGEVRVRVSGAEPEKALNYCAENGIEFRDASPNRNFEMEFTVNAADYPVIQSLDGRNGLNVAFLSSRGGKKLTQAAKRRIVFLICFSACVLLLAVSSLFIWQIDIEGNEKLTDAELLRALSDCGLEYGGFWVTLSADSIKNEMLLRFPDIAWLSVNIRSSRAEVAVHERVYKPDIINEAECCDVIASKSGVITKMSVLQGKAIVSVGDTVLSGETLVTGVMDSETGDTRFVHANAVIEARTWYDLTAKTPLHEEKKTGHRGTKRKFTLILGKKPVKIGFDSRNHDPSCDKINKLRTVGVDSVFTLPLGLLTEKCTVCETERCAIDKAAAIQRLEQTLLDELNYRIDGGRINEKHFTVSDDGEMLTVTLRAECVENIAKEKQND